MHNTAGHFMDIFITAEPEISQSLFQTFFFLLKPGAYITQNAM